MVLGKTEVRWGRANSEPRYGRHATTTATVALNTNTNGPLRSLPRVHKPCHQLLYSLPSITPRPPPLSTSPPSYTPWMLAIAPTTTVTTSTHPSTFQTPTPSLPPIQIILFPPTVPQTFSTIPNPRISTHLMFRVQSLPSSPRNSTPHSNSQLNTRTRTSPTTPFNWTHSQPISVRRVHTYLWHHRHRHHHLSLHPLSPMTPMMSSPPCPSPQRHALLRRPRQPLILVSLTHHAQRIV